MNNIEFVNNDNSHLLDTDKQLEQQKAEPLQQPRSSNWIGKSWSFVEDHAINYENLKIVGLFAITAVAFAAMNTEDQDFYEHQIADLSSLCQHMAGLAALSSLLLFQKNGISLFFKLILVSILCNRITQVKNLQKEVSDKNDYIDDIHAQNYELSDKNSKINQQILDYKSALESYKEAWENKKAELNEHFKIHEKNSKELKETQKQLKELQQRYKKTLEKLALDKVDIEDLLEDGDIELQTSPKKTNGIFDYISGFFTRQHADTDSITQRVKITFGPTFIAGNPKRDSLSHFVAETHKEYAERWNLDFNLVTENLLVGKCGTWLTIDCVPYWNKIVVLQNCLNSPKTHEEEWCVVVDDDMPVTNMKIDPRDAINKLRRGVDSSVIVARDVVTWNGDYSTSVNTGIIFVRKDDNGRDVIERIWERRNDAVYSKSPECNTLGTCKNQDVLHEQEAMARVLKEDRSLIGRVVTVVDPRDTYDGQEIALNTFERSGCFIRKQDGWGSSQFSYDGDRDNPSGAWREGDWMGQTAGVPVNGWYCDDHRKGKPAGPIRGDKLRKMVEKTVK